MRATLGRPREDDLGGEDGEDAGVLVQPANRLDEGLCVFSHLMNQVIHWSTCASVQFFCPCF